MKRSSFQSLLVLGLGSVLGYVTAAGRLDVPRPSLAADRPATSSNDASRVEGNGFCAEGTSRKTLLSVATTSVVVPPATPSQGGKKPNILVIWGDDIGTWNQ